MPEDAKPARQALIEEVFKRVKTHECPCCGTNEWHLGDDVVMHCYAGDAFIGGNPGPCFGSLAFCCGGCGFIRFHSEEAVRRLMTESDAG